MTYSEDKMNLFDVGCEYALAHCISADLKMGAGIAAEFNRRFDLKNKMIETYGDNILQWYRESSSSDEPVYGSCVSKGLDGSCTLVYNLITKERYWHKPTYRSLRDALLGLRGHVLMNNIKKLAMPRIGCGLDRLEWYKVRDIIHEVFNDIDIEIKICYL